MMLLIKLLFMLVGLTIVFLVVNPGTTNDVNGVVACMLAGWGTGDILGKIGKAIFGGE